MTAVINKPIYSWGECCWGVSAIGKKEEVCLEKYCVHLFIGSSDFRFGSSEF